MSGLWAHFIVNKRRTFSSSNRNKVGFCKALDYYWLSVCVLTNHVEGGTNFNFQLNSRATAEFRRQTATIYCTVLL